MDPSLELKYRSKKSCEREMEPERVQKRSSVPDFKLDKRRGSKVSSYSFFLFFFFFLNYTSLFLWPVYYWSSVVKNIDLFFLHCISIQNIWNGFNTHFLQYRNTDTSCAFSLSFLADSELRHRSAEMALPPLIYSQCCLLISHISFALVE